MISTLTPSRAAASAALSATTVRSALLPAPITAMTGVRPDDRLVAVSHSWWIAATKAPGGTFARSVGQPMRVTSETPGTARIPVSVRSTSVSCSRAISGFSIGATAGSGGCLSGGAGCRGGSIEIFMSGDSVARGCFCGASVRAALAVVAVTGIDRRSTATTHAAAASAPSAKPIIAIRLIAGGKTRRCGAVASPMMRAAEVLRVSCSSVSRERLRND